MAESKAKNAGAAARSEATTSAGIVRARRAKSGRAVVAVLLACGVGAGAAGCAASGGGAHPPPRATMFGDSRTAAPRSASATPADSIAPDASIAPETAAAPADAIATTALAPPCERTSGSPDLLCYPVYSGPVDTYVTMLDAGIPRFPQYPPLALAKRVQGTVRVRALVGADGAICEAEAIEGPSLLREPALQAAREARIAPAMKDGCPVPIWVEIPFEFKLPAGVAPAKKSKR